MAEASAAAQAAYITAGEAFATAAALVTTGRLMFEVACDLDTAGDGWL